MPTRIKMIYSAMFRCKITTNDLKPLSDPHLIKEYAIKLVRLQLQYPNRDISPTLDFLKKHTL